jgi:CO dehydrogenase maturation factor
VKIAVTGKGGVGKTTTSALLAAALHRRGYEVIAIDVDPDSNLAACMGYPNPESIEPLVALKDLIAERTGAVPGSIGGMFQLNPFVADIPEKYAVDVDGVKVLVAGAVKRGGAGCYCPENAFVRALVSHLLVERDTALVLDMEAGIEHLGRGTVAAVDHLLTVVEPSRRSVETAERIVALAGDIGLERVSAIGNKIRSDRDREFLRAALPGMEFAGFLPYDTQIHDADISGRPAASAAGGIREAADAVARFLEEKRAR